MSATDGPIEYKFALLGSGAVFAFVPQARNILFHLPAATSGVDWLFVLSWTTFTTGLVVV